MTTLTDIAKGVVPDDTSDLTIRCWSEDAERHAALDVCGYIGNRECWTLLYCDIARDDPPTGRTRLFPFSRLKGIETQIG